MHSPFESFLQRYLNKRQKLRKSSSRSVNRMGFPKALLLWSPDIVLEMARQEEHPSYMRFIRRGETTLNEFWQDACRSKCHDMLGTIYEWFYEAVLGLKPETEAYRTWTAKPPLESEFRYVEGNVESPYGMIGIQYDRGEAGDGIRMEITVPTSTTGFLLLPSDTSSVTVKRVQASGGQEVTKNGCRIGLKSGKYELKLKL